MTRVRLALAVAAGGALGALARHALSLGIASPPDAALPWGTLAANALGSFLVGLAAAIAGPGGRLAAMPALQAFAIAGFCGGFTTLSIFSLETVMLFDAGRLSQATAYVAVSTTLWAAGVASGHRMGLALSRRTY